VEDCGRVDSLGADSAPGSGASPSLIAARIPRRVGADQIRRRAYTGTRRAVGRRAALVCHLTVLLCPVSIAALSSSMCFDVGSREADRVGSVPKRT
jgi:hypothetical protein